MNHITHNHQRQHPHEKSVTSNGGLTRIRSIGGTAVGDRPILSPLERLKHDVRGVVMARIDTVKASEDEPLQQIDRVRRAYLLQNHRLCGERDELMGGAVVDVNDFTTTEFAAEQIARAILFSPMAADAAIAHNAWQLSRFNDHLASCAIAVSPSVLTELEEMLMYEIELFDEKVVRRGYNISSEVGGRLKGVAAEIAATRALKSIPELEVSTPDINGDLKGKDITVSNGESIVHIDMKRDLSFKEELLKRAEQKISKGSTHEQAKNEAAKAVEVGYFVNGLDEYEDGWKYIVNADKLGKINGLAYDERGTRNIIELIQMLLAKTEHSND